MSANSLKTVNYRNTSTPQTQKAAKGQKKNAAGGYSFVIDDFERAKRFVILGASEGYYTAGAQFAKENAKAVERVIENGQSNDLVDYIVDISTNGRAAKQQPGLFALAMAASLGTTEEKQYALSKLSEVARTATTLFEFVGFALQFRSWGRALKRAVASWYEDRDIDQIGFQVAKYPSREGWSHRDLIRLAHPNHGTARFDALAKFLLGHEITEEEAQRLPAIVRGTEFAKTAPTEKELLLYVNEFNLSWEMIPNDKRSEVVWKALVNKGMPLGALIRQLPTLTRKNVLKPLSSELRVVVEALTDAEKIKRARLHPINILIALKTYESGGRYSRGSNSWTPVREITDALNKAFYLAFDNVEATGKKFLLGVDVSPSMFGAMVNDSGLSAAEAVGALSLVIQKTEPLTHSMAFASASGGGWAARGNSGMEPLNISSAQRLDDVMKAMRSYSGRWGGTDCSLPMIYATQNNLEVDAFIVLTDNDTWAGNVHPHQALKQYNQKMNRDAKLIVLASSPSRFSIADPNSNNMLDIAGFDSSVPNIIREFVNGF